LVQQHGENLLAVLPSPTCTVCLLENLLVNLISTVALASLALFFSGPPTEASLTENRLSGAGEKQPPNPSTTRMPTMFYSLRAACKADVSHMQEATNQLPGKETKYVAASKRANEKLILLFEKS